jgi:hypothetical protein
VTVACKALREEDFNELYTVAADPLIWEQHPVKDRHKGEVFKAFFREALESGGTLIATSIAVEQGDRSKETHATA